MVIIWVRLKRRTILRSILISVFLLSLPLSASAQKRPSSRNPLPKDAWKCVNSFPQEFSFLDKPSPRNKIHEVRFPKDIFSLEKLDVRKLKGAKELKKYGILGPSESNHRAGSNLIIMALRGTGEWSKAYGLLGASMLNANRKDTNAYRSLFSHLPHQHKMYASYLRYRANLLFLSETGSLIGKREAYIFGISHHLNWRYVHNNYAEVWSSLKGLFFRGLEFYHALKKRGYDDKILRNVLGIALASLSLKNELTYEERTRIRGLDTPTIHLDALKSAIKNPSSGKGYTFLQALSFEIGKRGLRTSDQIIYPDVLEENEMKEFKIIIQLVREDLKKIECKK